MHLALNHLIMVRSAADQQFPFPKTLPHMQELDQGSNKATSPAKYIKKYMHIYCSKTKCPFICKNNIAFGDALLNGFELPNMTLWKKSQINQPEKSYANGGQKELYFNI